MASFVLNTPARTDLANQVNDDLDGGSMELRTGASPGPGNAATGTLLVTFTLPAKANNTVTNGVLTFGAIANANAVANGNANYARLKRSNAATYADADVGTSGNSIVLDNVNLAVNQVCSITSANITVPAGT